MVDRIVSFSVAAAATILAGCAVGPDYREPAVPVPQQFVSAETTRYTAENGDLSHFWTRFRRRDADAPGR